MPANLFQEVKERINLVDYISKFIKLKNRGGRYIGLCPFHSEKTPSFHVDVAKNLFHCFGCNVGGDIFEFFIHYHKVSMQEALNSLATSCGVNLYTPSLAHEKTALDKLALFFQENLSNDLKETLKKRGITEKSIENFKIGQALDFFKINEYIKNKNLNIAEYGFSDYSWKMFEKRIIFPICDPFGKICSFGGRVYLPMDNRAKYVNGPASKYFSKSHILYGLNSIKRFMPIYVAEGYIDVILMQQHGFNAVAPLGTACTKDQLLLLFEKTNEIIIAMDGDNSGQKSALNIAYLAIELIDCEHSVKFVQLPQGEDPASFLMHSDFNSLKHYELYEYIFMQEYQSYLNVSNKTPEKAVQVYKKLIALANKIKDKALKSEYRKRWKDLWWNRDKFITNLVKLPQPIDLPILLFKYVLMYPDILDDISEHFAQLQFDKFFKGKNIQSEEISFYNKQIFNLLNGENLDESFTKKINNLSMNAVLGTKINDKADALKAWYKVAYIIEEIINQEAHERINAFENNFCQEEWDKFKNWLDEKQNYDEE